MAGNRANTPKKPAVGEPQELPKKTPEQEFFVLKQVLDQILRCLNHWQNELTTEETDKNKKKSAENSLQELRNLALTNFTELERLAQANADLILTITDNSTSEEQTSTIRISEYTNYIRQQLQTHGILTANE